MRTISIISLFAGLGLAFAAPALAAQDTPAEPIAATDIPSGFVLDADGTTLVHLASSVRFPAEFAGFKRLRERGFDPSGEYIAIGYDHPLGSGADKLVVRIALVHIRQMSAHDHYSIMRQATMSHFSAPTVLSEAPATIPNRPQLDAYRGTFSGTRDGQPWRFSLTTVDYGYWSGRMAAAYPDSLAEEAQKDLDTLIAEIRLQQPKRPAR